MSDKDDPASDPVPLETRLDALITQRDFHGVIDLLGPRLAEDLLLPPLAARLGAAYLAAGAPKEALDALRVAVTDKKASPGIWCNLGTAAMAIGRDDEALKAFRHAIAIRPNYTPARLNLALALQEQGRLVDAISVLLDLMDMRPDDPNPHIILGQCYTAKGDLMLARKAYMAALEKYERNPRTMPVEVCDDALLGLALLDTGAGDLDTALDRCQRVLDRDPDHLGARHMRSGLRYRIGDVEGAYADLEKVLMRRADDGVMLADRLLYENYRSSVSPDRLLDAAKRIGAMFSPLRGTYDFDRGRKPGRLLRVGFLGADFHEHPVGHFLLPLLEELDGDVVRTHIYAMTRAEDPVNARLQKVADVWRDVADLNASGICNAIESDQIDILIDMQGPTAGGNMAVTGSRAAPVQMAWAAYPGSTGLSSMDYLISDPMHTPKGSDRFYAEALVRLPRGYICYAPPPQMPDIGPPPVTTGAPLTFGCFNSVPKLNEQTLRLWAKVLGSVPGARLLLKASGLASRHARARVEDILSNAGLDMARVVMEPGGTHRQMLEAYNRVDIALDPFPYSGGLTTLEALWMGVPVVTQAGHTFAGRHSAAHLTHAGLAETITHGPGSYVAQAVALARDVDGLVQRRTAQRDIMLASPLCNAETFARTFERVLRVVWDRWCLKKQPEPFQAG